jgi:hypothetical protein
MRINLRTSFGTAGLAAANPPAPEQAKALKLPADVCGSLDDGNAGFSAVPDRGDPGPEEAVRGGQRGAFYGALEAADLMAQGEDLQLKGGTSPKRDADEGEKGG